MRTVSAALLVFGGSVFAVGCGPAPGPAPAGGKRPRVEQFDSPDAPIHGTFTVGKETTFVTGPLDPTGHIDYAAAINERTSKGVTAENNANVAIWKVFGPVSPLGASVPDGFFEKMGMAPPPASGDYYVGVKAYAARRPMAGVGDAAPEVLDRLGRRPWNADENATIGGWLRANERPLAALREAVKRTAFYNPIIPDRTGNGSKGIYTARLPGLPGCQEVASAFAARGMLFLAAGNTEEAWQDLLACHRLARLVARGGTLVEGLTGFAMELVACRAEVVFLDRAKPDAKAAAGYLRDLLALPPLADVSEQCDLARLAFLEQFMLLDQRGMAHLNQNGGGANAAEPIVNATFDGTDWDPGLKLGNEWFDRLVALSREKDRAVRVAKFEPFMTELRGLLALAKDPTWLARTVAEAEDPNKARGEALGTVLIAFLMPAANQVMDAADRARQTYDNVLVAYALAGFHRANGRYPDSLTELAPAHLKTVPGDLFGEELIYRPSRTGFLLYSVGVNGLDEGGRGDDSQPPGDDIAIRIPLPAKP